MTYIEKALFVTGVVNRATKIDESQKAEIVAGIAFGLWLIEKQKDTNAGKHDRVQKQNLLNHYSTGGKK
ncbi:hypothetical protein FK425_RS09090 [Enterococcus hirae]